MGERHNAIGTNINSLLVNQKELTKMVLAVIMSSRNQGNQGDLIMKALTTKLMMIALVLVGLSGCASNGMYTGGENLAMRGLTGALVGTAIGGLTSGSNDVRGGLRKGAAYGAGAGLIFGAGENYQNAQRNNAVRQQSYSTSRKPAYGQKPMQYNQPKYRVYREYREYSQ